MPAKISKETLVGATDRFRDPDDQIMCHHAAEECWGSFGGRSHPYPAPASDVYRDYIAIYHGRSSECDAAIPFQIIAN
jgi:hypothetical protein